MAKKIDPKDAGGTAVVEDEVFEVPVVDTEDEEALSHAAEVPAQGADEGEEDAREEQARVAAKAEPEKKGPEKPKATPVEAVVEAPKPEPTPVTPATPEPTRRPLTPIERAERDKRKKYAQMWQEASEEAKRLEQRVAELQAQVQRGEVKVPAERLQAMRDKLRTKLKDVSDLEAVAEAAVVESVQEAATLVQERDAHWQKEIERVQLLNKIGTSWLGARVTHRDFDEVLQKSGILPLITERNGSYANPYLARRIYLSADPGEEAYRLAMGALEAARPDGGDEDTVEVPPAPKADVVSPTPPAAPVKPVADAEAERRGARQVIEQEEAIIRKPKGIAGLRSASTVKTRWTKAELDKVSPLRREDLFKRFPDLERFYLSE